MEKLNDKKKIIWAAICVLMALVSMFGLSKAMSSPKRYSSTIASLDEKKETVTGLSAGAAATSAAITVLPGDALTPIADQLADLTGYFLAILCVIYLEKYLLTILGYFIFLVLVPIFFLLLGAGSFVDVKKYFNITKRILIIGLTIWAAIPIGEKVSGLIHETYKESIEETINNVSQEIEIQEDEDGGLTAIISKITDGVTNTAEKFKNTLSDFVEAIAVMIVTDCLIPIVVLAFCLWIIKYISGMPIDIRSIADNLKRLPVFGHKRTQLDVDENE